MIESLLAHGNSLWDDDSKDKKKKALKYLAYLKSRVRDTRSVADGPSFPSSF